MEPTRQKLIGENKVTEYRSPYWDKYAKKPRRHTFVNGEEVAETYDQAVARLGKENVK